MPTIESYNPKKSPDEIAAAKIRLRPIKPSAVSINRDKPVEYPTNLDHPKFKH